jgi:hypothetical protein
MIVTMNSSMTSLMMRGVADEYVSLFTPQQSTTEYAAAIQLATTPQIINHPYRFHLEAYKRQFDFAESDPAASEWVPWAFVE